MRELNHHLDLGGDAESLDLFAEEVSTSEQMQGCCEGCFFCFSTLSCITGCASTYASASCYSCDCGS